MNKKHVCKKQVGLECCAWGKTGTCLGLCRGNGEAAARSWCCWESAERGRGSLLGETHPRVETARQWESLWWLERGKASVSSEPVESGLSYVCVCVWATCVCVCLCVKVGHVSHCRAVSLKDCETGALSAVVYDSLMGCGTDREGSALGHHPRSTTCFSICRRCPAVHRAQARAGKRRKTTAGITCSGATPELCPEPTWDTAGNF